MYPASLERAASAAWVPNWHTAPQIPHSTESDPGGYISMIPQLVHLRHARDYSQRVTIQSHLTTCNSSRAAKVRTQEDIVSLFRANTAPSTLLPRSVRTQQRLSLQFISTGGGSANSATAMNEQPYSKHRPNISFLLARTHLVCIMHK
jgi:hypothetical protein